jgi:hypothetical protein
VALRIADRLERLSADVQEGIRADELEGALHRDGLAMKRDEGASGGDAYGGVGVVG